MKCTCQLCLKSFTVLDEDAPAEKLTHCPACRSPQSIPPQLPPRELPRALNRYRQTASALLFALIFGAPLAGILAGAYWLGSETDHLPQHSLSTSAQLSNLQSGEVSSANLTEAAKQWRAEELKRNELAEIKKREDAIQRQLERKLDAVYPRVSPETTAEAARLYRLNEQRGK